MKYLDKKNLFIREKKDEFDFEYNEDVIFNSDKYDKEEITNYKTREKFIYKELVFCTDNKGGGYLYPPELYGSNKVIEEYRIENWIFDKDRRTKDINNESFQDNTIEWIRNATTLMNNLGTIVNEAGHLINTTTEVLTNAANSISRNKEPINRNVVNSNINTNQNNVNYNNNHGIKATITK